MSEFTLDEAIRHCEELVEQEECFINYPHSDIILGDLDIESRKHFVAEHRQLAEWLTELKEAKRLLKAAVEDFNEIKSYLSEPYSHLCDKWKYTDEALKIIGE